MSFVAIINEITDIKQYKSTAQASKQCKSSPRVLKEGEREKIISNYDLVDHPHRHFRSSDLMAYPISYYPSRLVFLYPTERVRERGPLELCLKLNLIHQNAILVQIAIK